MKKQPVNLSRIQKAQREFAKQRRWEKYHTPKNIAMALSVEAAELLEIFLWLDAKEAKTVMRDKKTAKKIRDEIADVFYWISRLSDILEVDLEKAFWEKMKQNAEKYPIHLAKGNARKYDSL